MISAVVILYYPDDSINDNLKPILSQTQRLFVVDNTEQSQRGMLRPEIISHPKLTYLHTGTNEGIARPLNIVCRLAIEEKYSYLLTMDQDSFFKTEDLKRYFNYVSQFPEVETVGMFGVNHAAKKLSHEQNPACDFVVRLITSGSILNLQHFERIGNFDENFFIDHVDTDYCFRILRAGLKNVFFKNIYLEHRIGTAGQHVSLKTLKVTSRSLHSPIRLYYMVRNYLQLSRYYKQYFPDELGLIKKDTINRIKNNFLYGGARWKLLRFITKAITDFRKGNMGKISG